MSTRIPTTAPIGNDRHWLAILAAITELTDEASSLCCAWRQATGNPVETGSRFREIEAIRSRALRAVCALRREQGDGS
jgi:hypothetical protein